jgi:hypothetical protein
VQCTNPVAARVASAAVAANSIAEAGFASPTAVAGPEEGAPVTAATGADALVAPAGSVSP